MHWSQELQEGSTTLLISNLNFFSWSAANAIFRNALSNACCLPAACMLTCKKCLLRLDESGAALWIVLPTPPSTERGIRSTSFSNVNKGSWPRWSDIQISPGEKLSGKEVAVEHVTFGSSCCIGMDFVSTAVVHIPLPHLGRKTILCKHAGAMNESRPLASSKQRMHFKEKTALVGNSVNRDTTERGLSTNVPTLLIRQRELFAATAPRVTLVK